MVTLIILDGWGVAPPASGNALSLAETPYLDGLINDYPAMTLQASGEAVGLPWGEMGNSEVGHLSLGAGKVLYQNLPLINRAVTSGEFFKNKGFLRAVEQVKKNNSNLHLMGLVSDGGVHSSQEHLYALLDFCKEQGLEKVFIHGWLDGRDTAKNAALNQIAQLQTKLQEKGIGKLVSLCGRYWAMDRDNHWDRVAKAYNAMVKAEAEQQSMSPLAAIEMSYQKNIFDEEFEPTVIDGGQKVEPGDAVICFNFRADRMRQVTKALALPAFEKFDRQYLKDVTVVTMTEYEKNLPVTIAFEPGKVENPLARVLSEAGKKQLHIAETEKYAHVTFFFNGGKEDEFEGEDRMIVPSPQVASYAEKPEMSSDQVKSKIIESISKYDFIVANFANADMVGHTGDLEAAKKGAEALDKCLAEIVPKILEADGTLIITADHGNAEEMINLSNGKNLKEHTTNPVLCVLASKALKERAGEWPTVPNSDLSQVQPMGILADVAPTILEIMKINKPEEMTGRSLL